MFFKGYMYLHQRLYIYFANIKKKADIDFLIGNSQIQMNHYKIKRGGGFPTKQNKKKHTTSIKIYKTFKNKSPSIYIYIYINKPKFCDFLV